MAVEEEQRRVLIALRRVFLTNLGVLVARRRHLSSALQARPVCSALPALIWAAAKSMTEVKGAAGCTAYSSAGRAESAAKLRSNGTHFHPVQNTDFGS